MQIIDAFGMQCPKPLVLAKKQIDGGVRELAVQVDNETACKNLTRLGGKTGLAVSIDEIEGGWLVSFSEGDESAPVSDGGPVAAAEAAVSAPAACSTGGGCGYAVFVSRDTVGDGEGALGRNLMKMALYTLSEAGDPPASLLFMNAGVKLVAGEEPQVVESVQALAEQGTEVLVCGTCLDFYGLKDSLGAGEVSNMYDILERMREAAKVITL
ncbi:MAG: sulfurtransferase-like selenium metabolism protein YedF [Gordonibacter sp.]|uniref:sulfurtransferase-like selenium metabolism protein YedF n=1 Tax=Gordonibacter sp. TaxID=1968902 RepID=UPI002FC79B15